LRSDHCHRTLASSSSGNLQRLGQKEKLWREFFSDPSQWWDNRSEKVNAKYPDFKHKMTQKALWLDDRQTPPWVEAELAVMAPGTIQLTIFSWNRRLARYVKLGQYEKAMELFHQMQQEGISPNKFTFVPVLNTCAKLQLLEEGRLVHQQIIQSRCEFGVFVGSSLVDMYTKCGSMEEAQRVFHLMPSRDVVSWTAMILGHVKCGEGQKALELFQQMQQEGVEPNSVTFLGVLNACATVVALDEGRHVHELIIRSNLESDLFVANSLINMYTKCESMDDAWRVFKKMQTRDVISWTAMILGHVKCGEGKKALEVFQQMRQEGVDPDPITFVGVLNACASIAALEEGRGIEELIIQCGCESRVFVSCSLVDLYIKCGSMEDAWRVFNKMPIRNVVSWTAMILGHVKCGQGQEALKLFQQMQQEGVEPNAVTFVGVLNACASVVALEEGRCVERQIIQSGCESNVFVCNSLIDMYGKCGSMGDAWRVFKKMPTHNVVSWTAMILGLVKCGEWQEALELFRQMQQQGVEPDPITFVGVLSACASVRKLQEGRHIEEQIVKYGHDSSVVVGSSLVDMYTRCGSMVDAWRVFHKMSTHDVVSWTAMILGHVKCDQPQKALELFEQMQQEGVKPNPVTFVGVLNACTSVVALEEGRRVHEQVIQSSCESNVFVVSSLIDMYAKCGSMEDAWRVFNKMHSHNLVSWTAMLRGLAMHGHGKEALVHFERMCQEGVDLDDITFVCLLSACSHAGLVDEGLCFFDSMGLVYNVSATLEHYACMVDLLGRAGHLQEAEDFINIMCCEPSASVWKTLLNACRIHGYVEMGERIAKQVLKLDPANSAGYVPLPNIHAAAANGN